MALDTLSHRDPRGHKPPDINYFDPISAYVNRSFEPQQPHAMSSLPPITRESQTSQNVVPNPIPSVPVSFASLVAKPKNVSHFPDLQLPNRQYGTKDGVSVISFSASECQAANQQLAHTLIAKFQIGRPTLPAIKSFIESNWKVAGRITMSPNWDDRHIVFILDSEDDVTKALTSPYRKVMHSYFRLFRWSLDYDPKRESTKITKWIRLPGLPIQFFNRAFVKAIISSFANFLDIDDRSKAMNSLQVCRACVEIDIANPIPPKVWINTPGNKGFFQDIVVEGSIQYCQKCKLHGHDMSTCRRIKQAVQQNPTPSQPGNAAEARPTLDKKDDWKLVQKCRSRQVDHGDLTSDTPQQQLNFSPIRPADQQTTDVVHIPGITNQSIAQATAPNCDTPPMQVDNVQQQDIITQPPKEVIPIPTSLENQNEGNTNDDSNITEDVMSEAELQDRVIKLKHMIEVQKQGRRDVHRQHDSEGAHVNVGLQRTSSMPSMIPYSTITVVAPPALDDENPSSQTQ